MEGLDASVILEDLEERRIQLLALNGGIDAVCGGCL